MKKSNKLSFRKKGINFIMLFAFISSTFAYGTGINYFSGYNGSFKLTLNGNTKQKKKQIALTHSVSLFENSKVYAFQYKENNNKDSIPFALLVIYATGICPSSVFCADMNEDSNFDIALANWSSDDVSVLENLLQVSSILPAEPFSHLLSREFIFIN